MYKNNKTMMKKMNEMMAQYRKMIEETDNMMSEGAKMRGDNEQGEY